MDCLVVGGGSVALRKVHGLIGARARVTVVAPQICEELQQLGEAKIVLIQRTYQSGEAAKYRLVFAATSSRDVNRQVYLDADAAGVFVNSADDPGSCTFMLPSIAKMEPIVVSVSTAGTSPSLAVFIRDQIAERFGSSYGELANLLGQARYRVHQSGQSSEQLDWKNLIQDDLAALVEQGNLIKAQEILDSFVDRFLEGITGPIPTGIPRDGVDN